MSSKLTQKQRELLTVLDVTNVWTKGADLGALLRLGGVPAAEIGTAAGVHMTAASLVRRGLAAKRTINGHIHYRITDDGIEVCSEHTQA